MSVLMVKRLDDFTEMKALLNTTDGNLASHSSSLEKSGYIESKKEFVGKTKTKKPSYQWAELLLFRT
jgi:hypothetical protein